MSKIKKDSLKQFIFAFMHFLKAFNRNVSFTWHHLIIQSHCHFTNSSCLWYYNHSKCWGKNYWPILSMTRAYRESWDLYSSSWLDIRFDPMIACRQVLYRGNWPTAFGIWSIVSYHFPLVFSSSPLSFCHPAIYMTMIFSITTFFVYFVLVWHLKLYWY